MRSRTFLPAVCYLLLIALVYTVTASSGEFDLEADLVHLARVDPQAAWKLIELATAESAVSPRTTTPWQAVQFQSVPVIPACQYPNTIPTNPVVQDGTTSGTRLFSNVEHEHLQESEHNHDHQDHSFEIIYVAHVHDDNGQMTTYEVRFVPAAERAFDSLQNANPTRLFDLHGVTLGADGPTQVLLVSHIDSSLRQKTTPRQTSTNPRDRTWITYNPRRVGLDLRVLVINVDFSDAPSAVDLPTIATDMFRDSVNPVYLRSSFGQAYFGTVDVTPVLRMPDPRQFYASATSNLYYLFQDGPGAAEAAGYDFFSYDYWVVLTDVGGFPYGGLGYIGWSGALVFSAYDTLVEHELGHNFNMWHANGWIVNQGDPRPYGNGFNAEYNDFYDIMGFGARDFNVEEKIAAGWSAREQAVIAVDPSASNYIEIHDVGTFEKFFHYPAIPKLVVQVPRLVVEAPGTGDFYHLSFRNVTGSFGGYLQFTYSETNSEHDTKIVQAIPYRDTPYGPISNQALPRGYTLTDEPNQIHLTTLHSNHGNGVSNVAVVYHPTDVADASSQLSASWDLVYSPVQITSYAPISIRGIHAGGAAVSVSALGMQADLLDQGGNDPVLFVSPSHSGPEPGVLAFVSNLCGSEIQSFQHVQGADTTYEPPRLIFFKPTGGSQEVTFTFPPYEFAHSDFPKGLMRFQVRMTDTLPWSAITQLELWTNHGKVMDIYRICEVCEDNVEIEMTSKFLPQGLTQILLLARHKSGIWVSSAPFSVVMTTTNGFEYTPPPASDIVCHAPWTPPPPFPGGQNNSGALTAATSLSAAAVLALIVAACL